jgi:hypothetical protein
MVLRGLTTNGDGGERSAAMPMVADRSAKRDRGVINQVADRSAKHDRGVINQVADRSAKRDRGVLVRRRRLGAASECRL